MPRRQPIKGAGGISDAGPRPGHSAVLFGLLMGLLLSVVPFALTEGADAPTGRNGGDVSVQEAKSAEEAPSSDDQGRTAAHLNQQVYQQGTSDLQPIMRPDGTILALRKSPRSLEKFLRTPAWLHLGVIYRTRYEGYDNGFRRNQPNGEQQVPLRTFVRLGIRSDPVRFFAEFMDARAEATTPGAVITNRMEDENDILQLYAGLGTHDLLGLGVPAELTVGRFTMDFSRRRLIARNHYGNAPNAFSGVHLGLGDEKRQFRVFLVRPVLRYPTSLDKEDANTLFWGFLAGQQQISWLRTELYGYFLNEKETVQGDTGIRDENPAYGVREHLNTLGVRIFKPRAQGELDYEVESDWQFGRSSLQTGSPIQDTFAHFQHAEIGYTFDLPWDPNFLVQYDYASGDRDPNDNRNGRFNSLYGVVNFEYSPSGIWQPFSRSNISSPGYRLTVTPKKAVMFYVGHRFWWLAQARDQWIGSGLQDPTGKAGNSLGQHVETRLHWVIGLNWQIETGWDYLVKGSFIKNIDVSGAPNDKNVNYFFFQTVLSF